MVFCDIDAKRLFKSQTSKLFKTCEKIKEVDDLINAETDKSSRHKLEDLREDYFEILHDIIRETDVYFSWGGYEDPPKNGKWYIYCNCKCIGHILVE